MADKLPKPAKVPCGSCPYRRDVPAGIWAPSEYVKLPRYDAPTWAQPPGLFMCHQGNDHICSGWLACHGSDDTLALRFPNVADPSAYSYETDVPVFASGQEACDHGLSGVEEPDERAQRLVGKIAKKRGIKL